ncbi:MAG TPA: phosphoribosylamine--glycine ligase, partial [Gammaproteobacteria bacterium]|nr:phosphoribosylamine--glycine ligase [Gammaproteobacteria bacterium]
MKVLVIGGGGREHALAWKLAQDKNVDNVLLAPGNAGSGSEPKMQNISVSAEDIDSLLTVAKKEKVDLTIVGPEAPLVMGVVDRFAAAGLRCFGPSAG